jgi:tetratricopeptide (TPR) repeat protein
MSNFTQMMRGRSTLGQAGSLSQLGERARGLEWAQRALAMDPEETSILYNVRCVYALLGEAEKAISCLEKATACGDWYKGWAQKDSDLDSLRSHPLPGTAQIARKRIPPTNRHVAMLMPKGCSLKGDVKRNNFPTTGGQQDFCLGIQPL